MCDTIKKLKKLLKLIFKKFSDVVKVTAKFSSRYYYL